MGVVDIMKVTYVIFVLVMELSNVARVLAVAELVYGVEVAYLVF